MSNKKEYYNAISPDQVHMFFKQNMIDAIHEDLKKQILTKEEAHLASGQGLFIYEEQEDKDRGRFHLAVYVQWRYDAQAAQFTLFNIITYHLYSGNMPDEILDELNELSQQGQAEWKTYDDNTEPTKPNNET